MTDSEDPDDHPETTTRLAIIDRHTGAIADMRMRFLVRSRIIEPHDRPSRVGIAGLMEHLTLYKGLVIRIVFGLYNLNHKLPSHL